MILLLKNNLRYTNTVSRRITVGMPDDGDCDDDVLADDVEPGAIFWELNDEDEEDCICVDGTV